VTHTNFQELLLTPFNVHEFLGFEILSSEKHVCHWEISESLLRVRGLDPCEQSDSCFMGGAFRRHGASPDIEVTVQEHDSPPLPLNQHWSIRYSKSALSAFFLMLSPPSYSKWSVPSYSSWVANVFLGEHLFRALRPQRAGDRLVSQYGCRPRFCALPWQYIFIYEWYIYTSQPWNGDKLKSRYLIKYKYIYRWVFVCLYEYTHIIHTLIATYIWVSPANASESCSCTVTSMSGEAPINWKLIRWSAWGWKLIENLFANLRAGEN